MRFLTLLAAFAASAFMAAATLTPASAAKHALVIGIDRYPSLPANRQLQKAVNDAEAVGSALARIGFSVTRVENVTKAEMSRAIGVLEQSVAPGDTVFLFFAGHGIDIGGSNYLLPADIPFPLDKDGRRLPERTFRDASFNAAEILGALQVRKAGVVIAVFDACREPFDDEGKRSLNVNGGLTDMKPVEGMFIMFSAGAKQLALDRLSPNESSRNSVFTRELVPLLKEPGLSLVTIAKLLQPRVRELAATVAHVQTPAYYDQIVGDFYLNPTSPNPAANPALPPQRVAPRADDVVWERLKDATDAGQIQKFITGFPESPHRPAAEARLAQLASLAWSKIKDLNDRVAIRYFIARFPTSVLIPEAERKLAALDREAAPKEPVVIQTHEPVRPVTKQPALEIQERPVPKRPALDGKPAERKSPVRVESRPKPPKQVAAPSRPIQQPRTKRAAQAAPPLRSIQQHSSQRKRQDVGSRLRENRAPSPGPRGPQPSAPATPLGIGN